MTLTIRRRKMFSGKSVSMLDKMSTGKGFIILVFFRISISEKFQEKKFEKTQNGVQTKIARGSKAGADVGYWEQVASELKIYRARI